MYIFDDKLRVVLSAVPRDMIFKLMPGYACRYVEHVHLYEYFNVRSSVVVL